MTVDRGSLQPPSRAVHSRTRRVLVNLGVLGASATAALLLAEVVVRLIAPQQLILKRPDMWQPDDTLGWVHQRNANTTVNTGERTVRFVTDREGFRVGARGRAESPIKVLLIGDSFMEALQVDYEQSVAGLLETRLSAALGRPVAVRSVAVGGWDPDQYLLQLRRSLAHDSLTIVVTALFLGNDIISYRRDPVPARVPVEVHAARFPRRASWGEFVDAALYPINDFLEVRSQLFILAKGRLQGLLIRLGLSAAYFPAALLRSTASSRMWANTAAICSDMVALAKVHHTALTFVLIPQEMQVDRKKANGYLTRFRIDPAAVDLDQPNRRLLGALLPQGIDVIDATDALRAADRRGEKLYGDVDSHFTAAGHATVADTLVPLLVTRLRAALASRSGQSSRHVLSQ